MIPRRVVILGREYPIRRTRMPSAGMCDFSAGVIWLRSGLKGSDADATLLHESVHAVLHESGLHFNWTDEFTESVVRALEHGLFRAGYKLGE